LNLRTRTRIHRNCPRLIRRTARRHRRARGHDAGWTAACVLRAAVGWWCHCWARRRARWRITRPSIDRGWRETRARRRLWARCWCWSRLWRGLRNGTRHTSSALIGCRPPLCNGAHRTNRHSSQESQHHGLRSGSTCCPLSLKHAACHWSMAPVSATTSYPPAPHEEGRSSSHANGVSRARHRVHSSHRVHQPQNDSGAASGSPESFLP
jgi:hypothetical protein